MRSGKGNLVNIKVDKKCISNASEHDAERALSSMYQGIPCHSANNIRASCMALYFLYIIDAGRESFPTSAGVYSLERVRHAKPSSALEIVSPNTIGFFHRSSFAFLAPSLSKPRLSSCLISS